MLLSAALFLSQADTFRSGLLKDFEILKSAYTQIHPGLNRYNTAEEIESRFEKLKSELGQAKNLKEAYRAISELTGGIKCGHSYPNFYNQPDEVMDEVFKGRCRLPFYFRWIDGKMVVVRDFSKEKAVPAGTQIVAIDDVPTNQILRRLMPISRSDGGNDAKRVANLEVLGLDRFETFDIYYPLYYQVGAKFELKIENPDGKPMEVLVEPLTSEERLAAHEKRPKPASDSPWELRSLKGGYQVLRMPSWVMYNSKWDWKGFLQKAFTDLDREKVKGLIIDIRGNEGGDSVGDIVLAYLIDKPISLPEFENFTRYRRVPAELRPYLDTWDRSFDDWSTWSKDEKIKAGGTELYRMTRWNGAAGATIQPKSPSFNGKVFVLVDSSNSSATFEFARMFRAANRGKLIGSPTGGNQRGINGSAFYFLRLPNSKIEVDIPLVAAISPRDAPDAGLEPDIAVFPTAKDIQVGRDVVLMRAVAEMSK